MNTLATIFGLLGLVGTVLAVIALFRPLPNFKLPTRPRALALLVVSLIVLVIASSMLPAQDKTPGAKSEPETPSSTAREGSAPYVVGQPLDIGDLRVVITRVTERDRVGTQYVSEEAASGGVLVVVEYTVENIGDRPKSAYQLPSPHLIDSAGVAYDPDVGKTITFGVETNLDRKALSDLNPGIKIKDAAVFEVSKAAYDPTNWTIGVGAGNRLRIAIADKHPEVKKSDWGDCSGYKRAVDQLICQNPDLARRDEILGAKAEAKHRVAGEAGIEVLKPHLQAMEGCKDRACLSAVYDRLETITADWPTT